MITRLSLKNFANRAYKGFNKSLNPKNNIKNNSDNNTNSAPISLRRNTPRQNNSTLESTSQEIVDKINYYKQQLKVVDKIFIKNKKQYENQRNLTSLYSDYTNYHDYLTSKILELNEAYLAIQQKQGVDTKYPDKIGTNFVLENLTQYLRLDTGISGDYFKPYIPEGEFEKEKYDIRMNERCIQIEQKISNLVVLKYKEDNVDTKSAFWNIYSKSELYDHYNDIDNEADDRNIYGYFEEIRNVEEITKTNDNYAFNDELDDVYKAEKVNVQTSNRFKLNQVHADPKDELKEKSLTKYHAKNL